MPELILDIAIPADRLLALYQGRANRVQVRSRDGRSVNLPAHHLRPFIGRDGIHGSFRLVYEADGTLLRLEPLASPRRPD